MGTEDEHGTGHSAGHGAGRFAGPAGVALALSMLVRRGRSSRLVADRAGAGPGGRLVIAERLTRPGAAGLGRTASPTTRPASSPGGRAAPVSLT